MDIPSKFLNLSGTYLQSFIKDLPSKILNLSRMYLQSS